MTLTTTSLLQVVQNVKSAAPMLVVPTLRPAAS